MKRIVKPTGQFQRDIKLAKKQNRDIELLFDAVTAKGLTRNSGTTTLAEIGKAQENAILDRIGFLSMR